MLQNFVNKLHDSYIGMAIYRILFIQSITRFYTKHSTIRIVPYPDRYRTVGSTTDRRELTYFC